MSDCLACESNRQGSPAALPRLAVCVLGVALILSSAAAAGTVVDDALDVPARMTLDGAAGARPGMTVAEVSDAWGIRLRPSYEVRPDCGQALLETRGLRGYAIFMPRGRFGALFLRKGAISGRGVKIGSSLAELRRRYPRLTSRPDRYVHGGRQYFLRRARTPHWELRFDIGPGKRVTQIVFGDRASVRLDEGCA